MKLHILSDLHLEGSDYTLSKVEADVTIFAGDIISAQRDASLLLLRRLVKEAGRPVLYVPGNHEYYGAWFGWLQNILKKKPIENLHLLDNSTFVLDGVKFVGSTLWANVVNDPDDLRYPIEVKRWGVVSTINNATEFIEMAINDFNSIKMKAHQRKDRTFKVADMNILNDKAEQFLKKEIQSGDQKKVVITHFPPSLKSQHAKFTGERTNDYFMNAKDHLFPGVNLWIHGHTHAPCDYQVGATQVVCNPRGYPRTDYQGNVILENPAFNEKLVIEV